MGKSIKFLSNLFKNQQSRSWINYLWVFIFIIVIVFLGNTLVSQLKSEEEKKVKTLAEAYTLLGSDAELGPESLNFLFEFTYHNTTIPVLVLDEENQYAFSKNIDSIRLESPDPLQKTIESFQQGYPPIVIDLKNQKQYLYYKNSKLLNQLEYYPYVLIGLILVFILFTLWYFRTIRRSEQSNLWAGLAKETAHQIGTPLSSIMGWIELLKLDPNDTQSIDEIEKDVERLQSITERFSKIGSTTDVHATDLVQYIDEAIAYLQNRISPQIDIQLHSDASSIQALINPPLFGWVIENIVKNAVDSLKDKGSIEIFIREKDRHVLIDIQDNGPGIASGLRKRIFEPGFSTKKRGWGLGLSLAKRIVESYHHGKIYVLKSEPHKQTVFRIQLDRVV